MEAFDDIPVRLEIEEVIKQMRVRKVNEYVESNVKEIIEMVRPVVKPKAFYQVAYVENKNGDSLYIGGVKFTSRVLRVNLDKVERVFPYVATCGRELDEINVPSDDYLRYYCLDTIKNMALYLARDYLQDYLARSYALGQVSKMGPGTGAAEDWPIEQQKELFSVLGNNVEALIGVRLTDKCLMIPLKSLSGIFFPTEVRFESCQLCPREACIGRRAPYDPELVKKYRSAL